ncbi:MAG: nicotinate-nucleotide--dimethylbenzimidazole phosphoribosyltransferase [Halofilum sp. (in: g-proteobacteria)]|nr:nicotinate-nucleotide--dimethylbenzimidazole phosphoribosyltransferase [Halofilum sp. (in: g-proteobacteria)]
MGPAPASTRPGLDAQGRGDRARPGAPRGAGHPFEALALLGGFELAALAGACIACAGHGIAVLVDGFIATTAALAAVREVPAVAPWLIHAHRSAEPGHARVLAALEAEPLIDLGMRLGEGSGAAVTVPLLRTACALHNGMATFAEAGVSRADGDG